MMQTKTNQEIFKENILPIHTIQELQSNRATQQAKFNSLLPTKYTNNGKKAFVTINYSPIKEVKNSKLVTTKVNDSDFIIFCDENDESKIKAIENSQNKQKTELPVKFEKKKGLTQRNLKSVQQQENIQISLQTNISHQINKQTITTSVHTVQKLVTKTTNSASQSDILVSQDSTTKMDQKSAEKIVQEFILETSHESAAELDQEFEVDQQSVEAPIGESNDQIVKSNIELIKEAVVPIINLTLDETSLEEATLNEQSIMENKENDPTLLSIDLTRDEELEFNQQDDSIEVCVDIYYKKFSNEIYLYMLERELKYLPDPTYMSKQPEVNNKMRAMLVDWLIDVGIEYELENETIFLAISYVDRFLSSLTISLQNFQLLGTAALFISSKYEEIYPPQLKEFIFVTDNAYTKAQMLAMEKIILKSLNFSLGSPTIFYFLKYFLTTLPLAIYVQYFAEYLCFLSLLHTDPFLSFSPSDVAVSSIILALHTYEISHVVNLDEFKQLTRKHFSKDVESDAKAILIRQNCVNALYELHKNAAEDEQQAIYNKYSSMKYLCVATAEIKDEVPLVQKFFN